MLNPPWWPGHVNAGEVVYPPGGTYGPRTQRDYQLVLMLSGWVELELDGVAYRYRAGEAFLLRPQHREIFRFATDQATRHSWVAARVATLPLPGLDRLGPAPPVAPFDAELDHLVRVAGRAQREAGAGGEHLAAAAAQAALLYFWHEAGGGRRGGVPRHHEAVVRAQALVDARLGERLTLGDLAAAASVSPEHLCRLFRHACGLSPMEYVWQRRTREGLRLLAATGLTVKEIADRCGFQTAFHFSRRIKAACGLSPTAYRARHWNP